MAVDKRDKKICFHRRRWLIRQAILLVLSLAFLGVTVVLLIEKMNENTSRNPGEAAQTQVAQDAGDEQTEDVPDVESDEEMEEILAANPYAAEFLKKIAGMSEDQMASTPFPASEIDSFFENVLNHDSASPVWFNPNRPDYAGVIPYDGKARNITCWGDSMTEGYGSEGGTVTLSDGSVRDISFINYPQRLQELTGITTNNCGVGGETSIDIAVRQGGIEMVTDRNVVVTAEGSDDFQLVNTYNGEVVYLDNYSGFGETMEDQLNHVYVNNRLFELSLEDEIFHLTLPSDASADFTSGVAGDGVSESAGSAAKTRSTSQPRSYMVPEGTRVYTAASQSFEGDILIIEMGSNGGWDDLSQLIEQYDAMLTYANCDYYIILGDTDAPLFNAGLGEDEWEATLRAAFGDHFMNMRTYLMENGLKDNNLTPTYADALRLVKGGISDQLRADWTHLNANGYYSKGLGVYKKGVELGYWK